MAESDMMLIAIRMDAKGAITDTQILDKNFKSLSQSFRKGTQDTEKLTTVMAKKVKVTKQDKMATVNLNPAYLKSLAGMDALTSGLNQGISAQYKMIDAKLASGDIDEEEAERQRKIWKARERYTASLEMLIAVLRLGTVAHMVYTGIVGMTTTATTASTVAVKANTVAWYANPMFWAIAGIVVGILAFVAVLAMLMDNFKVLEKGIKAVNDQWAKFFDFINKTKDAAAGIGNFVSNNTEMVTERLKTDLISGRA